MLTIVWLVEKAIAEPGFLIPSSFLTTKRGHHRSLCTRKGLELRPHTLETAASLGDMKEQ